MNNDFRKFLSENWLRLAVQTVFIATWIVNLYIAYRLAPILVSIDRLNERVLAVETDYNTHTGETKPLIERFLKFEEKVDNMADDIREIKQDIKEIEKKI